MLKLALSNIYYINTELKDAQQCERATSAADTSDNSVKESKKTQQVNGETHIFFRSQMP